jgi:hypothetical protein
MLFKNKKNCISSEQNKTIFFALVALCFLFWLLYRSLFNFPVLFDETIGKAIFFGLPVLIFASVANYQKSSWALRPSKLFSGLLRGLAYGGLIGFFSLMIITIATQKTIEPIPLFLASSFWGELLLATLTAFWESLFFFGFFQTVLSDLIKSEGRVILFVSLIFLVFHIPNLLLRFVGLDVTFLIGLLYLFGFGQAVIFSQEKNIYPLIITHTVWGMILLIHL